jgi:uncharacterized protein (TIGR03000 family)
MFEKLRNASKTATLVLGVLLMAASPAAAQRGGHGGGGHGGGGHGGGGGWHGGGGHGGGGGWNSGWRHSGWGWGGIGWGGYYPGYYSAYSYPTYAYDYPTYTYDYPSYASAAPAGMVAQSSFYPPSQSPEDENKAHIHVRVPANATVWFDGDRTAQTGTERDFLSPPLTPGKNYTYEIKARWMQGDQPVEQTRTIRVQAGETTPVDFLSPSR